MMSDEAAQIKLVSTKAHIFLNSYVLYKNYKNYWNATRKSEGKGLWTRQEKNIRGTKLCLSNLHGTIGNKLKIVCHCIAITKQYDQENAMETTGYKNIIHTLSRTYKSD